MVKSYVQRLRKIFKFFTWFIYRFKSYFYTIVLKVFDEEEGVISLFLSLNVIPVAESVKIIVNIIICNIEIKVCAVKFFVYLFVYERSNFLIYC